MQSECLPQYVEIDGFRFAESFSKENYRSGIAYKPDSEDIIIATYPKCGTTWMCQIVRLVLMKGEHNKLSPEEYFDSFPFLELCGAKAMIERLKPGCIKTHLPFDHLNFSEDAKYIYVTRHPQDCLVSYYHHTRFFPVYRFSNGTLDAFFNLFIKGMVGFNDYFDNLLSWYEQKHRPNILFITYESMKADHRGTVLKVANFLKCPLTEKQMDNVIKYSSFDYMKIETNHIFDNFRTVFIKNEVGKLAQIIFNEAIEDGFKPVGNFIRKGKVGEGKLVLSNEQIKKLNERILEKTKGSNVMSLWKETK